MRKTSIIVALAFAVLFTCSAPAATILWGTAINLTDDNGVTDVSTNGTLVEAINAGGPEYTINGVTYKVDTGTGVGSMSSVDNDANNTTLTIGGSAVYKLLFNQVRRNAISTFFSTTVAAGLLTSGQQYEIQIFFADGNRNRDMVGRFDSGASTASVDLFEDSQFVIGTFTRTAPVRLCALQLAEMVHKRLPNLKSAPTRSASSLSQVRSPYLALVYRFCYSAAVVADTTPSVGAFGWRDPLTPRPFVLIVS